MRSGRFDERFEGAVGMTAHRSGDIRVVVLPVRKTRDYLMHESEREGGNRVRIRKYASSKLPLVTKRGRGTWQRIGLLMCEMLLLTVP